MNLRALALLLAVVHGVCAASFSTNGNRLTYLDSDDPFYPGLHFPKLTTPQWVGEEGVDAVIILSIDDMRETPKYETYLRPILERLKKIDGRAPVSIMANAPLAGRSYTAPDSVDAKQIQSWLKEGLSIECHSISHPCPLCQRGDFNYAFTNFHNCVDLLSAIPGNKPVAFRMPCCDSMNSPSPRFYAEIFNRTSAQGNFLGIDSSVMVVLTTNDTSLPRELVVDGDGRERFRKYLPTQTNATTRVSMGSFTTTIEDYPYPYVIGKLAWEFPCIAPSDWEAHNLHGSNNPKTVEDWQRALDAIVLKQGVMTFIFHPHGWINSEQMVEFIDYAVTKYGKRVKFLTFKEAQERLNKNLLSESSLRRDDNSDLGVRLVDLNNDGFMDVLLGFRTKQMTRTWNVQLGAWHKASLLNPFQWSPSSGAPYDAHVRFGILRVDGFPALIAHGSVKDRFVVQQSGEEFDGIRWSQKQSLLTRLQVNGQPIFTQVEGKDRGVRLGDIDDDGRTELIVGNESQNAVFKWSEPEKSWKQMPFALPESTSIVDAQGRDAGLRFVDVDGDGYDDVLFSNHERYSLHLFRKDARNLRLRPGWSDEIISGVRSNALTDPIPPIVREGTNRNNGVWFARSTMWIQNEDTAHLPDKVDRRTFKQLLALGNPPALSPEDSLKAMRAPTGFKVELVASEPLIRDPIAFEWAGDGKLWVLEMSDYPLGVDGKGAPGGRLRVLEDVDGDGRYDKATTFLDQLSCPEGFHPWRKGAVVIAGKDLFYAEDTDGNGEADVREVLFTGFSEGNQQHRANGFSYGFDGWLYGANGESDGNVRIVGGTAGTNQRPINIRGQDFRFHPDHRSFQGIGGRTQYGLNRDDFGNWFGNNNSTWLWHHSFPVWYLTRNPQLPLKTTKTMLANYPNFTRCFPISKTISRFNDPYAANHVTSGNSPIPYRDELFGDEFATSIFISEPVHNLVHREVLEPNGVSFKSRRAKDETNSEFLASADNWFRPTMIKTGPDGALYVADMYRLVIEHPEWIPAEMQARLDLRAGADKGRIFRVFPDGAKLKPVPNLAKLGSPRLAAALDSPNGWQRDTAQRLLIERGDPFALPALEQLVRTSTNSKVKIQALWTLHGLNALAPQHVLAAMKDPSTAVREHALQLSEQKTDRTELFDDVLQSASDPNARLRYQLAFTLGEWGDARAADALLALLRDPVENIRNAALSSAPRHAPALLALVEKLPADDKLRAHLPMLQKLASNPPAFATPLNVIERTITLTPEEKAERAAMLARYARVPSLRGNAKNGAALFKQHCAQCHRLKGEGQEVGPDLGMMSSKPPEQLVAAILDPNAALEGRYKNYTVTLRDGHETGGIIVAETPTTLTFRTPHRPDETFLRADVRELSTSNQSLMPEGFEAAFTPQQLADLIAFVTGR